MTLTENRCGNLRKSHLFNLLLYLQCLSYSINTSLASLPWPVFYISSLGAKNEK